MPLLHDFVAIVAQAQVPTSTPTAVKVTLVDDGKAWWREFVVPAVTLVAALVGGVGGVVIGGRMNRTTMNKLESDRATREKRLEDERAERETRLEDAKAEREARLEEARAQRRLVAESRQAVGALRLLLQEFRRVRATLELEPFIPLVGPGPPTPTVRLRDDHEHLIAMWVSDTTWGAIEAAMGRIAALHAETEDRGEAINHERREQSFQRRLSVTITAVSTAEELVEGEMRVLLGAHQHQAV